MSDSSANPGTVHSIASHPTAIPDLISFWDFQEDGETFTAQGEHPYVLRAHGQPIPRAKEGVFGPRSLHLQRDHWLSLPRNECPALNRHGAQSAVTVCAWINWHKPENFHHCEAIAGMWSETNKKRQYCLFLNIFLTGGKDSVSGHISSHGGPTPGWKYSAEVVVGATEVPRRSWSFIGFTYDGSVAKAYLNGRLDEFEGHNPYPYPDGLLNGGPDGSDFTVGSVHAGGRMWNFFHGLLGGVAVYGRALTDPEMASLALTGRSVSN